MHVPPSRRTILVVEDDDAIREILADALYDESYIAIPAGDGEQALVLLEIMRPDLICLDYQLPGIQGSELIDAIHKRCSPNTCSIMMLTASRHVPREVQEAVQIVITKPFDIEKLFTTIAGLISSRPG